MPGRGTARQTVSGQGNSTVQDSEQEQHPERPRTTPDSVAGAGDVGETAEAEPGPVVISGSHVVGLRATRAEISGSSVEDVQADRVDLTQGRARNIAAKMVQIRQASAIRVEGDRVVAEQTAVVGLIAGQARFVRSRIGVAISRQVELGTDSRIFVHIGPLSSAARPMVGTRTAAAFGAGLGLALVAGFAALGRRRNR